MLSTGWRNGSFPSPHWGERLRQIARRISDRRCQKFRHAQCSRFFSLYKICTFLIALSSGFRSHWHLHRHGERMIFQSVVDERCEQIKMPVTAYQHDYRQVTRTTKISKVSNSIWHAVNQVTSHQYFRALYFTNTSLNQIFTYIHLIHTNYGKFRHYSSETTILQK